MTQRAWLGQEEIHVWRASLQTSARALSRYWQVLPSDERARAVRFRFGDDRRRFVVSHGVLRIMLARYLGLPPESLTFTVSSYGKPELEEAGGLRFNMAHSLDVVAYVVARERRVGIDVEWIKPLDEIAAIAAGFLSAAEQAAVQASPVEHQCRAFYVIWTRKEAYLKARGDGLSRNLQGFSVSAHPDYPALLEADGDIKEAQRWTLGALDAGTGYAGAFAIEGRFSQVVYSEWQHE